MIQVTIKDVNAKEHEGELGLMQFVSVPSKGDQIHYHDTSCLPPAKYSVVGIIHEVEIAVCGTVVVLVTPVIEPVNG